MKTNLFLKTAIVAAGFRYNVLSQCANAFLKSEPYLKAENLAYFVAGRQLPTVSQAGALARVLGVPAEQLFPKLFKRK